MANVNTEQFKTEWFCEARFQPQGIFLNIKGSIADRVLRDLDVFKHWQIGENIVDFFNVDDDRERTDTESAYVSFRNIGYRLLRPGTKDHFHQRANKFFKAVFADDSEFKISPIVRIGVRVRIIIPSKLEFGKLERQYLEGLIGPHKEIEASMGMSITDCAVSLDFVHEGRKSCKLRSGPMKREQMERYFKEIEDLPETGIYLDLDVFQDWEKDPQKKLVANLCSTIMEFSESIWSQSESIARLFL